MATTPKTGILKLPNEILVQVARNLSGSVKNDDPQRDLLNLAVTCKKLVEPAREGLCHAMILDSSKVHILLSTLFRFPDLRDKVKSLTIETLEPYGMKGPRPIFGLDINLLHNCICEVQALKIDSQTKEEWITALKAKRFETHGTLLSLLMTMLPQLEELYLGGSALYNFPSFRDMITPSYQPEFLQAKSDWNFPKLSCIMSSLGPKLKVLEFPNNRYISIFPELCLGEVTGISHKFPELRLLILPFDTIELKLCQDFIPPKLETLILTNHGDATYDWDELLNIPSLQHDCFPNLCRISLYRGYRDDPIAPLLLQPTTTAKLECHEYISSYDFRWESNNEKFSAHAWMFTDTELRQLEKTKNSRLEVEMAEIKLEELQREKAKARWMKRQPKLVEKGVRAIRYLFNGAHLK